MHLWVALKPGEADELRQKEGHVDCASDYILRDRVRYSVIRLTGEAIDAVVSGWGQLGELARQRRKRKRAAACGWRNLLSKRTTEARAALKSQLATLLPSSLCS